jgi:hypothetical protein
MIKQRGSPRPGQGDVEADHVRAQVESAGSKLRQRDKQVTCVHCGRTARRKSRHQTFCSRRCRVSAHRARMAIQPMKISPRYPHSGDETQARKNASIYSRLRKRFSGSTPRIFGPLHVIEAEVYGGRDWRREVSPDGVVVDVAWLQAPSLIAARSSCEKSFLQEHENPSAHRG